MSKPLLTKAISEIQDHTNISTETVCNQFVQISQSTIQIYEIRVASLICPIILL